MGTDANKAVDLVGRRLGVLTALMDGVKGVTELAEVTDSSRSTANRAVRELEEAGLVERADGGYAVTLAGRLLTERYLRFREEEAAGVLAAEPVLTHLPPDCPVDTAVLAGCRVETATETAPYRPRERLLSVTRDADRVRVALPALGDPQYLRSWHELVAGGGEVELLATEALFADLDDGFPRLLSAMAATGRFTLRVGDVPDLGLALAENDGETTVLLAGFGDDGVMRGVVENDSDDAVQWGKRCFERLREGTDDATDRVVEPDVPTPGTGSDSSGGRPDEAADLPAELLRQGFVRLSVDFFADRPVADPAEAWRRSPGLAEVNAGYAVERTTGDGETVTERLTGRLRDGTDCALLGPPGSGKSTVCKRVACEWYREGDPVFYRESGRGDPFGAVGALVDAAERADGRPLVVVEDALRPDAAAVLEAVDRLPDRVAVLVDARESEWADPPGAGEPARGRDRFETVGMPSLAEADRERFVDRFRQTVEADVDVPTDRLLDGETGAGDGTGTGDAGPAAPLLLSHRLAAYADPLLEGETGLEADAAAVLDALEDAGRTAVDVGLLVNLLNVAGLAVEPALVGVLGDEADVEAALDVLDGRAVFRRPEGYETVHESWSVAFLAAYLDREPPVDRQVGRVLTRLFGVADDPETLQAVAADPKSGEAWADDTVQRVLAVGRRYPKLAPLFGTGASAEYELPEACPDERRAWVPLCRGDAYYERGDCDRAEAEYETRLETARAAGDRRAEADCLRRLGATARTRGEYDLARERHRRSLDFAGELGADSLVAWNRNGLGSADASQGAFDSAVEHYRAALEWAREAGDRALAGTVLGNLGAVEQYRGEYGQAREYLERSLEHCRALGDREGVADAHRTLGVVASKRGDYERAREHYLRSVETNRELGRVGSVTDTLNNLGIDAQKQGDYERAREYLRESLSLDRERGDRRGVATTLNNLGEVAFEEGDLGEAAEYYRRSRETAEAVGDRRSEAIAVFNLARVDLERGRLDGARERASRSLELRREVGDKHGEAKCLLCLARVARDAGDPSVARERFADALDRYRAVGDGAGEATALRELGSFERQRGEHGRARERLAEAADRYEAVDDPAAALDCLADLVECCEAVGDDEGAREYCERAVELAEQVGREKRADTFRERCQRFESTPA